jgi:myo-inositol-1(or 4)-monophosphatase
MNDFIKGEMVHKALELAIKVHNGQIRKGSGNPYIIHPVEVGLILSGVTKDEEIIAAGILHDTLEDTYLSHNDILKNFGKRVADLVLAASENLCNRETTSWKERKTYTINHLLKAADDVKLISCADKLSNIKSFIREHKIYGDKLWSKFNSSNIEEHKWYYNGILKSLEEMKNNEIYEELKRNVKIMFG